MCNAEIHCWWIELVEFQHSEVGVEIVGVLLRLFLNVFLEELKVNWIVAKRKFRLKTSGENNL